jgi:hypothetical protein
MFQNDFPFDPRHVGVPSIALKMMSEPMVRSVQTMHLSCVETNTTSKQTKTIFHLIYATYEYHLVCPKRFQSLWYISCKLCTYLASRLILSPNRPKCASTWPTSPRSTIGCAWKDFHECGTFGAKACTYLTSSLILSANTLKRAFTWPMPPRRTIGCAWKDFHARGTFGANRTPIFRLD